MPPTVTAARRSPSSAVRSPRRAGSRSRRRASPDPRPAARPTGGRCGGCSTASACVQIDSVNVLQRAHYLPLFSRAARTTPTLLDRGAHYAPRRLFEYWGHEASLLPVALQPLLRWRMERAAHEAWGGMRRIRATGPSSSSRCSRRCASAGRWPPARCSRTSGRSAPARGGAGATSSARSSGCSGAGGSRPRGGAASSASTTCPSACCPPR